ncbi:hypothetical protein BH09BAC5_BH09BAC5_06670 [soil metagenome]
MKKALFFLIFCFAGTLVLQAQNVLLYSEDFQTGGPSFTLNSGGPGSNVGTNQWAINNNYNGAPTYNNTMSEDSTYSGTITFAPHSQYLHINDLPSGITNCNYNPSNPSDRFAYTTSGICTMGMDSVHMSFFYMCQGSSTAFGQVYYSVNNGPWIQTGQSQYSNKYKWKYEDLSNPAFGNVTNLRFGFRWQNNNGPSPDSVAFAIDDINIVANYSNNITITIDSVAPNPVCQLGLLLIYWRISDTLCDGTYAIDLSDQFGNFAAPNSWVASIYFPQTSGVFAILLPANLPPGNCYKVRLRRTSPPPFIIGTASACFSIVACPNVITTLQPVVTFDTNAVCIGSAIDVPFYSTGVYGASNVYTAQLSDSNGVFAAVPPIIGSAPNSSTYDPSLGSPPGTVSGLVPTVPPGCGYYIRVVSSNPNVIGAPWGPFCIGACDITTNNHQDLAFCVTDCAIAPLGADSLIDINVNTFNNTATYFPGNLFTTQLMSSMTFGQIGANGILGSVAATGDTTLNIHIPCKDSLAIIGVPIGMNYLRIVATNSSVPDNSLGSLIRLTIGAPNSTPPVITAYNFTTFVQQDTFCVGDIVALFFTPYSYSAHSTYMWSCNGINNGVPFVSPSGANSNSLYVNLGGQGILTFQVQETSYGCAGPWSPIDTIVVLGLPNVNITGPHIVCQGDTNSYHTLLNNNTYYSWGASGGIIVDTSNNVIDMSFPNVGVFQLTMHAINGCGSASSTYSVTVKPYPTAFAGNDTVICSNSPVTLVTPTGAGYSYSWTLGSTVIGTNNSVIVTPTVTTTYNVAVSIIGGCISYDTVTVFVNNLSDSSTYTQSGCNVNDGTATAIPVDGTPPFAYAWSNGQTTQTAVGLAPGTYTCIITDAGGCSVSTTVTVTSISSLNPDAGIFVTITQGQSTQLNGTGGIWYSWSPANDLSCTTCQNPIASPTVTTTYTLTVSDSIGCTSTDTVTVFVDILCGTVFVPNAFSPNGDNQNDILYVRGACIKYMDFYIFNRLGEQVFYSNDPAKGWDGVWRGVPCENAVFTYVVKGTLLDGSDINLKGNVSLIK